MQNGKRIRLTTFDMQAIDQAIVYVTEHFHTKLSADQLAIEVNLPKEKLLLGIRHKTNLGLHEYIVLLRIKKSKELLVTTDYPLKIIASKIGYPDKSYYCKVFRKLEGTSPTAFRLHQVV